MENTEFRVLFGTKKGSMKKICVISPVLNKEILECLRIKSVAKGALYSTGSNDTFSLVCTKMGAPFVGDAALYLENTPCQYLIFFGLCGALPLKGRNIGQMHIVKEAFSQDSFINMLLKKECESAFYPDEWLYKVFLDNKKSMLLIPSTCLTVGSLKLEGEYLKMIKNHKIDIVDMETSVFYLASRHINKRGVAILTTTDILTEMPYYNTFSKEGHMRYRQNLCLALGHLYDLIMDIQYCL